MSLTTGTREDEDASTSQKHSQEQINADLTNHHESPQKTSTQIAFSPPNLVGADAPSSDQPTYIAFALANALAGVIFVIIRFLQSTIHLAASAVRISVTYYRTYRRRERQIEKGTWDSTSSEEEEEEELDYQQEIVSGWNSDEIKANSLTEGEESDSQCPKKRINKDVEDFVGGATTYSYISPHFREDDAEFPLIYDGEDKYVAKNEVGDQDAERGRNDQKLLARRGSRQHHHQRVSSAPTTRLGSTMRRSSSASIFYSKMKVGADEKKNIAYRDESQKDGYNHKHSMVRSHSADELLECSLPEEEPTKNSTSLLGGRSAVLRRVSSRILPSLPLPKSLRTPLVSPVVGNNKTESIAFTAAAKRRQEINKRIRACQNQIVDERNLKIVVGSWNVAQQPPPDDNPLELSEWLLGIDLQQAALADKNKESESSTTENDPQKLKKAPPLSGSAAMIPSFELPDIVVVSLQEVELGGAAIVLETTESKVAWTETIIDCLNAASALHYERHLRILKTESTDITGGTNTCTSVPVGAHSAQRSSEPKADSVSSNGYSGDRQFAALGGSRSRSHDSNSENNNINASLATGLRHSTSTVCSPPCIAPTVLSTIHKQTEKDVEKRESEEDEANSIAGESEGGGAAISPTTAQHGHHQHEYSHDRAARSDSVACQSSSVFLTLPGGSSCATSPPPTPPAIEPSAKAENSANTAVDKHCSIGAAPSSSNSPSSPSSSPSTPLYPPHAHTHYRYRKAESLQLVGIVLIIIVRHDHYPHINHLNTSLSRTGVMRGIVGNKGAIGARFSLYGKRFLFLGAHFDASVKSKEKRNANYQDAMTAMRFPNLPSQDDELDRLLQFAYGLPNANVCTCFCSNTNSNTVKSFSHSSTDSGAAGSRGVKCADSSASVGKGGAVITTAGISNPSTPSVGASSVIGRYLNSSCPVHGSANATKHGGASASGGGSGTFSFSSVVKMNNSAGGLLSSDGLGGGFFGGSSVAGRSVYYRFFKGKKNTNNNTNNAGSSGASGGATTGSATVASGQQQKEEKRTLNSHDYVFFFGDLNYRLNVAKGKKNSGGGGGLRGRGERLVKATKQRLMKGVLDALWELLFGRQNGQKEKQAATSSKVSPSTSTVVVSGLDNDGRRVSPSAASPQFLSPTSPNTEKAVFDHFIKNKGGLRRKGSLDNTSCDKNKIKDSKSGECGMPPMLANLPKEEKCTGSGNFKSEEQDDTAQTSTEFTSIAQMELFSASPLSKDQQSNRINQIIMMKGTEQREEAGKRTNGPKGPLSPCKEGTLGSFFDGNSVGTANHDRHQAGAALKPSFCLDAAFMGSAHHHNNSNSSLYRQVQSSCTGMPMIMPVIDVREYVQAGRLEELLATDQLTREISRGRIFRGFHEQEITFPPTYKFDKGTKTYDTSWKRRDPAWTDRVLYWCAPDGFVAGSEECTKEVLKESQCVAKNSPTSLAKNSRGSATDHPPLFNPQNAQIPSEPFSGDSLPPPSRTKPGSGKGQHTAAFSSNPYNCQKRFQFTKNRVREDGYDAAQETLMSDHRPIAARFTVTAGKAKEKEIRELLFDLRQELGLLDEEWDERAFI